MATFNEKVENTFILGFRKISGISIIQFNRQYHFDLLNLDIIKKLILENNLIVENNYIKIKPDKLYIENDILWQFLDIDYKSLMLNCKKK